MEPFVLRFIRDINNNTNDDIIIISPLPNGNYSIKTKYAAMSLNNINRNISVQTLTYYNIFNYIHSLMILLINDDKPFQSVQFDVPTMPSVIIPVNKLDSYQLYTTINSILHVTLDSWALNTVQHT